MIVYKLTDENGKTMYNTQWGPNVTHTATGRGKNLCSSDVIHFYTDPLLAVLFNPLHAHFKNPRLWRATIRKVVATDRTKGGARWLKTLDEIPLPNVTLEDRVRFGILCAKKCSPSKEWVEWADRWLSGEDRAADAAVYATFAAYVNYADAAAANAATNAAYYAANAAYNAAYYAADYAASAAAVAADYAVYAAANAAAAAAAYAAHAAVFAADAYAFAASAYTANITITALDLISIAHEAVNG